MANQKHSILFDMLFDFKREVYVTIVEYLTVGKKQYILEKCKRVHCQFTESTCRNGGARGGG